LSPAPDITIAASVLPSLDLVLAEEWQERQEVWTEVSMATLPDFDISVYVGAGIAGMPASSWHVKHVPAWWFLVAPV
jgi:hypothetical protein